MDSNLRARWLVPIFDASVPELEDGMEQTIGEALVLPEADAAIAAALPEERSARARAQTWPWLERMLRKEWLPEENSASLWLALSGVVNGKDALLGTWEAASGRPIQVVAARDRIHLRARLASSRYEEASATEKLAGAVMLANEILRVEIDPSPLGWVIGTLASCVQSHSLVSSTQGGSRFIWAVRASAADEPRRWDETLLVVTDGVGAKLTVLKIKEGASPTKGESALPDLTPWFSTSKA